MDIEVVEELFEKHHDEYLKFNRIENPEFSSPDLCAFVFLDRRFPSESKSDMVSCATHDQIFLRIEVEQLETLTEEEIVFLRRCGVFFEEDGLSMFA